MIRLKWMGGGAALAAIAILVGSFWPRGRPDPTAELRRQNQALLEVVDRLNLEHRVAEVEVLQQHLAEDGQVRQTVIRFTELDRQGQALPPLVFGIAGNVPHFDALVIKFANDYVARGEPLRGRSLALFRRIYGDSQAPNSGYWIDRSGDVPDVYRVVASPSEFELRLWREFWSYATDPEKARAAGVRVAQGEAVYAPVRAGERWTLTLEADGGLSLLKQLPSPTIAERPGSKAPPSPLADARLHTPSPLEDAHARH